MNNGQRFCLDQEMHTLRDEIPGCVVLVFSDTSRESCRSISATCGQFLTGAHSEDRLTSHEVQLRLTNVHNLWEVFNKENKFLKVRNENMQISIFHCPSHGSNPSINIIHSFEFEPLKILL